MAKRVVKASQHQPKIARKSADCGLKINSMGYVRFLFNQYLHIITGIWTYIDGVKTVSECKRGKVHGRSTYWDKKR